MSQVQHVLVLEADDGLRLDRWFRKNFPQVRHGALEKYLRKGQVRVDGGRVKASHRVASGQTVRIPPIDETQMAPPAVKEKILSDRDKDFVRGLVLYEDDGLLVLNKPFGLAVQGGTNTKRHIDGLLGAFGKGETRPRLVHRLDRDTGGLLVLAKSRKSAKALGEFFQRHQVDKTYWALVAGVPVPREGRIDLPIAKRKTISNNKVDREIEKVQAVMDGKKALTDFQTVEEAGSVSFVALRPLTGRTHQLRVHCAAVGVPIIGDKKYGGERARIEGVSPKMHLFCAEMSFPHPQTRKKISFVAPLTGHMLESWKFFNFPRKPKLEWPDHG